jgi:hypothetical protein
MKLVILEKGQNQVVAGLEGDEGHETCPVLDFLRNQPANLQGTAKGFRALFKRYADGGRALLTPELFHEASASEGIWEFIKGPLRVFCFQDGGNLVILSHGNRKKRQTANPQDVARAVELRRRYHQAKQTHQLTWIEDIPHD